MKSAKVLEELSVNISSIISETSDIIWKQNLARAFDEYDENKLSVFFGISSDVINIQRILHDMTQEILSSTRVFDVKRHQKLTRMKEPYDNFFENKNESMILLHGAAHISYCYCKRIMDDFNNDPYDMEVYTFLNNLKDLLYVLGRVVNNFRIYDEIKYKY